MRPIFLTLLFLLFTGYLSAQIVVEGQVTDKETQETLPGVNVLVQGTQQGVITNVDGEYTIEVDPNATLTFSFVGYQRKSVEINGRNQIDVQLVKQMQQIDEVTVMAYSEKTKREISSSMTSLDEGELQDVTVTNVEDMLKGKVAGLHIQSATGQPGAAPQMRIRGVGSAFSPQDPLIVVDGIVGGSYNPNDVKSVTVLKDAAATGLYGSQAAAGVILITTKSGKKGETQIHAKVTRGVKNITTGNFEVMNGQELYDYHSKVYPDALFNINRPESLLETDYNWIDNSYKQAPIANYYLSASGGSDKTKYFLSADYTDEDGTALNSSYDEYNFRAKVSYNLSERISITSNITGTHTKTKNPHWSYLEMPFKMMPWDAPRNEEGELIKDVKDADWLSNTNNNIFHSNKYNDFGGQSSGGAADFTFDVRLTDWLKFESRNSLSASYYKSYTLHSPKTFEGESTNGFLSNSVTLGRYMATTDLLKFNKDFGDHSLSGLAGIEGGRTYEEFELGGEGTEFFPGQRVLSVAGSGIPSGNIRESAQFSVLTSVDYNYKQKYFLTASYRRDGSSKFGPNNRYANFFTGAVSWLMSEEDFMQSIAAVDYLKLRASYGAVGNQTFPNNSYYPYFSSYSFNYQYSNNSAAYPSNLGNRSLGWETSYPLNVGFDLTLYNRFDFTLDAYRTITKDLLFQSPLPYSQGFAFQWKNVGKMQNLGLEANLKVDILKNTGLKWRMNFNFATNKNKLLKLTDSGIDQITQSAGDVNQILEEGKEAFQWYMPKWLGVNPENGEPVWEDVQYDEATGERTGTQETSSYSEADFQSVGSPFPDFQGGITTTFSYKNLTLSGVVSYVYGNEIYNLTRKGIDNDGANNNVNAIKLMDDWSRWEEPGDNATHPEPKLGGNNNAYMHSSRYLEDGSYLRVRNVKLSYTLPQSVLDYVNVGSFTVYVSADNLITFSKFSGMDPDVPIYPGAYTLPGLSSFKYPISRSFLVGLDIKF
jgi:TonB-linked SusC/RagA family outer membrane protein